MTKPLRSLFLLCLLLLLPSWLTAQRPLDEGQRQQIGITSQQQKELEAIFADAGRQKRAIRARLRALYHELHGLYDSYDLDQKRAGAIRKEIVGQQQRLLALFADNEIKLRRILSREQFERLRAQMKAEREKHRHSAPPAGQEGKEKER